MVAAGGAIVGATSTGSSTASGAAAASNNSSSASSPSPTLNQLLTNTHPSQYAPPNSAGPSPSGASPSGGPPAPDKRGATNVQHAAAPNAEMSAPSQAASHPSPVTHNSSLIPNGGSNNLLDYNNTQSVKLENDHHHLQVCILNHIFGYVCAVIRIDTSIMNIIMRRFLGLFTEVLVLFTE